MRDEATVQNLTRLRHCQLTHGHIWRNNSGAYVDDRGRMVRYGLGNDSAQLNDQIKSSDLIGITPLTVTPEWVGHTVGVFTAYEVKEPGWTLRPGDKRGMAQQRFLDIVASVGGYAGFVTHPDDIQRILRRG